jgi:hypothetical protein
MEGARDMNYREQINALLDRQDAKGMEKYGQALEQNPAAIQERLQHSAEEQVDNLRYTLWAIDALDKWWWFPATRFVTENNIEQQAEHIRSEYIEFQREFTAARMGLADHELADLYHSIETYFRMREKAGIDVRAVFAEVQQKNTDRGYYGCGVK